MVTPSLSIIIVTWNTSKVTLKCIQSITKYLGSIKPEIIVVDNASSDDTLTLLKQHRRLKIISNSSNIGFSSAANLGAAKASGRNLLFLNSDIELIDDSLISMLKYFESQPKIGVIGPSFVNPNLSPQASVFPPQTIINAFKQFYLGRSTFLKYIPKSSSPLPVFAVSGGAILISRSYFITLGGWNQKYFFYFEDLDLCRHVNHLGRLVIYYPECRLIHHHGISGQHLANTANQWRRLIPSSILYHGYFKHFILYLITWSGQKFHQLLSFLIQ